MSVEPKRGYRNGGRIDDDAVAAYAMATNDPNPLYLNGQAVPPLFSVTLVLPAQWEVGRGAGDLAVIKGTRGVVHGEHDAYFWGIAQPGTSMQWDASIHGIKQTKGGVLVIQRILVTDMDGMPLVEHFWTNFHIGATIEGDDFGSDPIDHTFPTDARDHPVGSQAVAVDRDQAFRYAGVSGDHAGHAIDDVIAREHGYPGKILQGLCTFALCAGAVVNVGVEGDPRRLRRLAGRFSAPAVPRHDLVVNLYDAGRTDEGGRALAFEAVQNGVTVIKHGRAEVIPDEA